MEWNLLLKKDICLTQVFRSHFLLKEDRKKLNVEKEGLHGYQHNERHIEKVDQWEIPFSIGVLRWERNVAKLGLLGRVLRIGPPPRRTEAIDKIVPYNVENIVSDNVVECPQEETVAMNTVEEEILYEFGRLRGKTLSGDEASNEGWPEDEFTHVKKSFRHLLQYASHT
ncbi:unnamed protein product [Lactuca saligna]|uniref:Uncharacterized protein n=1 Tax=Lactuca saligna TaxID=75948 RepID=A0AA36EIT0_LACSI|nr:unnamed protein product [Lactuca saligna]